jgi:putative transposase
VVPRAYRFRVYPTAEQELTLRRTFGCVRWAWNQFLAEQRARARRGERRLSYGQTSAYLTTLKRQPEHTWLNEVSCVPLQQALRHLARAHRNWTEGRAREPVFKRKRDAVGHTVAAGGGLVRPTRAEALVGAARRSRKMAERSPSGIRPA